MKTILSAAAGILFFAAGPAHAAEHLKHFKDWSVSSYSAKGHRICYTFTQALAAPRGQGQCGVAVLVVTHAPPRRDHVVVSPCRHYGPGQATLTMSIGPKHLGFHTRGQYAYANEQQATIAAFHQGMRASIPAPAGQKDEVFSLRGFAAAYDAMRKDCIG